MTILSRRSGNIPSGVRPHVSPLRTRLSSAKARLLQTRQPPRPVYGIGEGSLDRAKGRALVSYLSDLYSLPPGDPRAQQFSNTGIGRMLTQVLNDLGFVVDLVHWTDKRFRPSTYYSLFIGHGSINFERISRALPPTTHRVYFATGMHWAENNRREERRRKALARRRGVLLPPERVVANEEQAYRAAHTIICLGNALVEGTFSEYATIKIDNAAYHDPHYETAHVDFDRGRKHFLFFSGWGNVHKGLDLALEAFSQLDSHLYVCTPIEEKFFRLYERELMNQPNVHLIGALRMRSTSFYELTARCNCALHLSCAEGSAGSVIECLHQGLVPVVTEASGLHIPGVGITLGDPTVTELVDHVRALEKRPAEWFQQESAKARDAALTRFSEETFARQLRRAIERILG